MNTHWIQFPSYFFENCAQQSFGFCLPLEGHLNLLPTLESPTPIPIPVPSQDPFHIAPDLLHTPKEKKKITKFWRVWGVE